MSLKSRRPPSTSNDFGRFRPHRIVVDSISDQSPANLTGEYREKRRKKNEARKHARKINRKK